MTQTENDSPVRRTLSPCINICELDEAAGLCVGCGRTLEEISEWPKLNDAAKEAVWSQLEARLEQLKSRE